MYIAMQQVIWNGITELNGYVVNKMIFIDNRTIQQMFYYSFIYKYIHTHTIYVQSTIFVYIVGYILMRKNTFNFRAGSLYKSTHSVTNLQLLEFTVHNLNSFNQGNKTYGFCTENGFFFYFIKFYLSLLYDFPRVW